MMVSERQKKLLIKASNKENLSIKEISVKNKGWSGQGEKF